VILKLIKNFPNLDVKGQCAFCSLMIIHYSSGGANQFEAALYLCEILYGEKLPNSLARPSLDWD